ncbi:transporter substrate-binding domain-containing protein [uncultured Legionella sp.]|uniref:transporter substrate-binding domain-containing protein n=1 Tax=uncultured Legionella sp. TaxID=210934 RepID=UPI0026021E9B|nr:transporter substrate-binding domain-containing protein [uncultured Legionella sp.]
MKLLVFTLSFLFSLSCYSQALIIGSSKFNPPFETWTSHENDYYGYDVDLIKTICKRMNVKCTYKAYLFHELFNAVNNNEVDLVIASIIRTEKREKDFLFSIPYLESYSQYITSTKSSINNTDDLSGKRIGVRMGTPYGKQVLSDNRQNKVIYYAMINDMFIGLQNNEIDAFLLDYEAAKYWIATNPGIYKLIGKKKPIGSGYAIMSNKSKSDLINRINTILLQMNDDGTFLNLYSKYFDWIQTN